MHMTLIPAYGRDYKSKAAVLADFEADKDFRDESFGATEGYITRADLVHEGYKGDVNIRYKNLRQVLVITLR